MASVLGLCCLLLVWHALESTSVEFLRFHLDGDLFKPVLRIQPLGFMYLPTISIHQISCSNILFVTKSTRMAKYTKDNLVNFDPVES